MNSKYTHIAYRTARTYTTAGDYCAIEITVMTQRCALYRKCRSCYVLMNTIQGQVDIAKPIVAVDLPLIAWRNG